MPASQAGRHGFESRRPLCSAILSVATPPCPGRHAQIMAPLSFVPDAAGASLAAAALHLKPTSSTSPIQVVATVSHAVSSFAPRQNHAFELQEIGRAHV